ncbi:MAG: DNA polymerase IV [Candidatus Bathyarchaeota archaeon]|nr:DNA polymerase IV [Candidatus Bathyarchaeota archaeon]
MKEKKRFIFHLDMDHFYTAVETRERPELKGKPLVVGADPKEGKGRGVVSTSNYEARAAGVRSGMPISQAWRLCPNAVYLPPNYPLYIKVSAEIMAIARMYACKFEQWGIDEAFLDVTGKVSDWTEAEALADQIKAEIKAKEHLTASIGVGPNKLIAKVASDYQKPDGLTVVKEEDAQKFLEPLPVRKLLWVGRKTEAKLNALGVKTIGDLAHYDPSALASMFGVMGVQMHLSAKGVDKSEVEAREGVKSVSHEATFEEDTADSAAILQALEELSDAVWKETTDQHLLFKTVTVKIRYQGFETHTKSKTLPRLTNRTMDIKKTAKELSMPYLGTDRKIRLIGVRVSGLESCEKQKTLF